jgi:hypothetical protein
MHVQRAQPHTYTELNFTLVQSSTSHAGDISTSLTCYGTGTAPWEIGTKENHHTNLSLFF